MISQKSRNICSSLEGGGLRVWEIRGFKGGFGENTVGLENRSGRGQIYGSDKGLHMVLSGVLSGTRSVRNMCVQVRRHTVLSACRELSRWKPWGVTRGDCFLLWVPDFKPTQRAPGGSLLS